MSPGSEQEEQPLAESVAADAASDNITPNDKKEKRRVKTGCLTCRRRRIKCGEEKPVCKNCEKARRRCEGVNQAAGFRSQAAPQDHSSHSLRIIHHVESSFSQTTDVNRYNQMAGSSTTLQSKLDGSHPRPFPPVTSNQDLTAQLRWPPNVDSEYNQFPPSTQSPASALKPFRQFATSQPPVESQHVASAIGMPSLVRSQSSHSDPALRRDDPAFNPQSISPYSQFPAAHATEPSSEYTAEVPTASSAVSRMSTFTSPLIEPSNRRLLHHFQSYLSFCISIYDRLQSSDSIGLASTTWAALLPEMALTSPALAHAILAISALHLSTLKTIHEGVARKHFWLSLKHSTACVTKQRSDLTVLATILLLSFYEVLTGDHGQWDVHLRGASHLLVEHDFAGMTQNVRKMRAQARSNMRSPWLDVSGAIRPNDYLSIGDVPYALLNDLDWAVDDDLVRQLCGSKLTYESPREINAASWRERPLTNRDVMEIQVRMDLYWWFCKMDIFHGLLTGDPLLIPFERWTSCPPRGPIGNLENLSATMDHLLLVLGRITDFGGRDRKRKLKKAALTGGHWAPPPGFLGPAGQSLPPQSPSTSSSSSTKGASISPGNKNDPRPSANEGRTRKKQGPGKTPPHMFPGMMPPPSVPIHMHSLFKVMDAQLREHGSSQDPKEEHPPSPDNIDEETEAAISKYESMLNALELFANCLGRDFQGSGNIDASEDTNPFGVSDRFSHPLIATIMAMYHMAKIVLRRFHPHSPPAAMVSAGVNAAFTQDSAQAIGRIMAGLLSDLAQAARRGSIGPILIAALQEITFPIMVAGVQYQDQSQRSWVVDQLLFIAKETGWKTAYAVASACERSWQAAGQQGRGPPYQRTVDRTHGLLASQFSTVHKLGTNISFFPTVEDTTTRFVGHNRELIDKQSSSRAFFATGLLAVEDDMRKLSMNG